MSLPKLSAATFALGVVFFTLSAGGSFVVLGMMSTGVKQISVGTSNGSNKTATKKPDLPRTEPCPLSGVLYSVPDRQAWEKRRPLGVMIENSSIARPQSGLSSADVVYEAVAEGGITRFLAVFYCQDADFVGPVRSARTYYMDWISEYGSSPLYVHVGGANQPGPADALGQVDKYGWSGYNDLNQFSIGFPTFYRDYDRLGGNIATEHTMYSSTQKMWSYASAKRKLTNVEIDDKTGKEVSWDQDFVKWNFKDDADLAVRPVSFSATFNFSNTDASYLSDYQVKWQYDKDSNSYLRFNGNKSHMDLNTNQQLLAKNIVVEFMAMSIADDGYNEDGHGSHTLYADKGTGKAMFLLDGKVVNGTWKKKDRLARTQFFDVNGAEVKLNKGLTWIEVLPIGQKVDIQ